MARSRKTMAAKRGGVAKGSGWRSSKGMSASGMSQFRKPSGGRKLR